MSKKSQPYFLDKVVAMPWEKAKRELQANIHMVAFDNRPVARDVIEAFQGKAGIKAAIAVLAAYRYLEKHGARSSLYKAIELYWQCVKEAAEIPKLKERARTLECELRNLEYMVYFAGYNKPGDWPLVPQFKSINEKAGIANVMMMLAAREINKDETTTSLIAVSAVMRFLDDGMNRKRKAKKAA